MIKTLSRTLNWQAHGKSASERGFPALLENEIHLWWLPLELNETEQKEALGWLSDIQRDKYVRRSKAGLHKSYLAGRYYLLSLLGAYTGSLPKDVLLSYTRLNKPYLSHHDQDIEFNFTDTSYHDQTYGLFAFSRGSAVGVDIEALQRPRDFEKIAQRRFTEQELDLVGEPIQGEDFLAIWTRKEAYGKATGKGINFKMNQRNLVEGASPQLSFVDDQHCAWQLLQFQPDSKHIAALVYAGDQRFEVKAFNSLNNLP